MKALFVEPLPATAVKNLQEAMSAGVLFEAVPTRDLEDFANAVAGSIKYKMGAGH